MRLHFLQMMDPWLVWLWDILLGGAIALIFRGLYRNYSAWNRARLFGGYSTIRAWSVFVVLALLGWSVLLLIALTTKSDQGPRAVLHFAVSVATFLAMILAARIRSRKRAS